ncbi:hypothetical protein N9Y42_09835 [Mariniblastus sp.]|nr:hypothetical protein [Mariniblastus sp.]
MRYTLMLLALLAAFSTSTVKAQIAADLLVAQGDALGGSTVSSLNPPFLNGLGQVGFNAELVDENLSIVLNGAEVFSSTGVTPAIDSIDGAMGFGNAGEFIYRPVVGGNDAVWNQDGSLIAEGMQAPGFDSGVILTSFTTPMLTDDGTAYWNGGINDGTDSTTTAGRVIYRRNTDGSIDVVLSSGGVVDGETVGSGSSSIGFVYQFSRNNENSIFELNVDRSDTIVAANDGRVLVNSQFVAAEDSPVVDASANPLDDNWDNFDRFTINNAGNYLFTGDTNGSSDRDEFIAYNGVIQLRQGDAIAEGLLSGSVDAVTINNSNATTFIWDLDPNDGSDALETLFFAGDASDMSGLSVVASVGDELDFDGDGIADQILSNFTAVFGLGAELALTEDGVIYAQVTLTDLVDGTVETDAIVAFSTGGSLLLGDVNRDGIVDFSDIAPFIRILAADSFQLEADIDKNGVVDFDDIAPFIIILGS